MLYQFFNFYGIFFLLALFSTYFLVFFFFNKTIIPLALVGYEMVIANSALRATRLVGCHCPTRARGIIVEYSPIFKTARVAKKI